LDWADVVLHLWSLEFLQKGKKYEAQAAVKMVGERNLNWPNR
jgi:hypothetical protein